MANDWDKVKRLVDNAVNELTKSSTLKVVGKYTKEAVVKRTRLGKGVDKLAGSQKKLSIKDSTKKTRARLKKRGMLSDKTTPRKANLTRSGEMLDSIDYKVNNSDSSVTVAADPANQRKVNELEEMGHKFMNLTKGEFKGLVEVLVRILLNRTK